MLDTYEAVKQLMATGMSEDQAGAVVRVVNSTSDKLATKADLEQLEKRFLERFATKSDLLFLAGFQVAVISLAVAIIKLF